MFLPSKFHGQRSLAGYHPWGLKESDMTDYLHTWHLSTYQPLTIYLSIHLSVYTENDCGPGETQTIKEGVLPSSS